MPGLTGLTQTAVAALFAGASEPVLEAKWHQPWSEPVRSRIAPRLAVALIASGLAYVEAAPFAESVTESRWPLVAITGPKGAATVPIVDVGPIYPSKRGPADPYWQTGTRPRAETDRVLSQAGIDLTPRTAHDVGIDGKGKVDWSFATGNEPATSATGEAQMPLDQTNSPPNIPSFLINWKTSAAGAIPILLACVDILQQLTSGHFDQTHLYADLGAIAAGFGLVGAQDSKK